MQLLYGYSVGDTYSFTDSIIETLDFNQTHLYEESTHRIMLRITAIDENIDGFNIRLTTEITDLSAGLVDINHTVVMEGHTSIVSAPQVYFTHTHWSIHSHEFIQDANNYQAATQLSGTVGENTALHLFYWNLSRTINETFSPYDMDQDGSMDAYTSISGYSARFNDQGVLLLREFITEFLFDNGARYYRLRQIYLSPDSPSTLPILTLETGLILGIIVIVTVSLSIITLYWYRRGLTPHE